MTSTPDAGASARVSLSPGDQVGEDAANRWEITRHLADGGFAAIYAVRPGAPETAERYGSAERALKCLSGTADEITQIGGEADKIAAVEGHENVLGLITSVDFTVGADEGQRVVGLVLELGAEDLYGFSRRMRPGERAWAGVFEQVAAGLEHIHSRGIVHGDVKPSNVLRIGTSFKIADFGVSRPADRTDAGATALARTLPYLPPESCSARGGTEGGEVAGWRPSQASDVWAIAVAMHRMLTGRHITAGITPEQQYELVCQGRYSIDDRIAAGWRQLFADCLAHDPGARTVTTAAEVRRRLADLAVPEDYVGVPWLAGAPRIVAVLQSGDSTDPSWPRIGVTTEVSAEHADIAPAALVLYVTRPGGRVQGAFTSGGVLLDAAQHLHHTAVPALAQQVRDAQRAANRAADERDRLQSELARLAAAGPETEVMDAAESTAQLQRLSSEVTSVARQRDELTRERDRLAREHRAMIGQVERLQRDLDLQRAQAMDFAGGYPYGGYAQVPPRTARNALTATLIVVLALVIAISIGLLVALLITNQTPQELIDRIADRLRS